MSCNVAEFIGTIQDGGAETLVKDYAFLLDKNKFNTKIIVLRESPDAANHKMLRANGGEMITIYPHWNWFWRLWHKAFKWWYVPYKLNKIIKEEKIQVLHVHLAMLRFVKPISHKLNNIKIFYTCHNEPWCFFEGKNTCEYESARYLFVHNDFRMIALHQKMMAELNERFHVNNTAVIRNGIDFRRFKHVHAAKEEVRKTLGISEDAYVVGHVGRFSEQKNHAFLVDVFHEISRTKEHAFLLMIGSGDLKKVIEDKLNSLGLQGKYLILSHRSDIPELMRAMDVFVFPSLYEGLSVTLIEAQVSGLRCVVSDTISKETFNTEDMIPISLTQPIATWCEVILDPTIKGTAYGNLDDYDMNKEIKRLEKLYLGERDG